MDLGIPTKKSEKGKCFYFFFFPVSWGGKNCERLETMIIGNLISSSISHSHPVPAYSSTSVNYWIPLERWKLPSGRYFANLKMRTSHNFGQLEFQCCHSLLIRMEKVGRLKKIEW
jgi:hypothetical protein